MLLFVFQTDDVFKAILTPLSPTPAPSTPVTLETPETSASSTSSGTPSTPSSTSTSRIVKRKTGQYPIGADFHKYKPQNNFPFHSFFLILTKMHLHFYFMRSGMCFRVLFYGDNEPVSLIGTY